MEKQRDRNHQDTLEEKQSQRIFFTEYEVLRCEKRERECVCVCHIGRELLKQTNGTEQKIQKQTQYIWTVNFNNVCNAELLKKKETTTSFKCLALYQLNIYFGKKKKKNLMESWLITTLNHTQKRIPVGL